jgi:hypothetical protein
MDGPAIRLSYTNPMTGGRVSRDDGRRFTEVDGTVLVVEHTYRARGLWTASLYTDHLDTRAVIDWLKADGQVFVFASRRRDLVAAVEKYVRTEDWRERRAVWLQLPKAARAGRRAPAPRRPFEMTPRDCELCDCEAYRWNGAPDTLRTDPPTTCLCDHPVSKHRFRKD